MYNSQGKIFLKMLFINKFEKKRIKKNAIIHKSYEIILEITEN